MRRIRTMLLAGTLATVVLTILPATSVLALPSRTVAAGSSPIVTARSLPPAPAPPGSPALTSFTVTTDSVVATATVHFSGSVSRITVSWDDNTANTWDSRLGNMLNGVPQAPQTPGTVVFVHDYGLPYADGRPFMRYVGVSVNTGGTTDQDSRLVTLTPRYQVTQYPAYFTPIDHCDPWYESESEWKIEQRIGVVGQDPFAAEPGTYMQSWTQDRLTNPNIGTWTPDFQVLAGSQTTRQLTMADKTVFVYYHVSEMDPVFDDDAGGRYIDLHPNLGLGAHHVLLRFGDDPDCRAEIQADVEVTLLRPGLPSGPVTSANAVAN